MATEVPVAAGFVLRQSGRLADDAYANSARDREKNAVRQGGVICALVIIV
jgi:hypothetical protein